MNASESESTIQWATESLSTFSGGLNTMSQRKLSSIEKHEGGLDSVKTIAEKLGVHLLLVEFDEGNEVVVATKKPFRVIS